MSASDDFEGGIWAATQILLVGYIVFLIGTATWVVWVGVHPAAVLILYAPAIGGLANIAIQWCRRKARGQGGAA